MTLLPLPILPVLVYAGLGAITGPLVFLLIVLPPDYPPPQRDPGADPVVPAAEEKAPQPKIKRDAQRRNRKTS